MASAAPPAAAAGVAQPGVPPPPAAYGQPAGPPVYAGMALAGWGQRVGALLLDFLILLIPAIVLALVLAAAFSSGDDGAIIATTAISSLGWVIITFLYGPLLMQRGGEHNGQTFGKQIVGIRVIREDGAPVGFGLGLLREFVLKSLVPAVLNLIFFLGSILLLVDYLWPLWDDQNRALHDMVASTRVVQS